MSNDNQMSPQSQILREGHGEIITTISEINQLALSGKTPFQFRPLAPPAKGVESKMRALAALTDTKTQLGQDRLQRVQNFLNVLTGHMSQMTDTEHLSAELSLPTG